MADNFVDLLKDWVGKDVTVVNPESYKLTALGKGLSFQTYSATMSEMGGDYVKITFSAVKQEQQTSVEQLIPLKNIKRISLWGDERLIHL